MEHEFIKKDGKIFLAIYTLVWDEKVLMMQVEVTDEIHNLVAVKPEENKFLNENYQMVDGVITYIGKDKDKYQK